MASKMKLSHPVALAAVRSKVVVRLFFIHCGYLMFWPLSCYAVLSVHSRLAMNH